MPKITNPVKNLKDIPELKLINLYNEKELLLYTQTENGKLYCDGKSEWVNNDDEFYKSACDFKGQYTISQCECCKKNKDFHKNIMECHKDLTHIADTLKKETLGKVNLYITGSLKHTAFKLLFELLQKKKNVDLMMPQYVSNVREYQWLNACNTGALIYSEDKFEGEIEAFDINSSYAFEMKSETDFPICEGTFVKLDYIAETPLYGVYKAKIISDVNKYMFRVNKNNFYTHIDLKRAKELNYEIELIQDGHENFLRYTSKERKRAKTLFGDYIDYMYTIRMKYKGKDKVFETYIKLLISSLWGQIVETKKFRVKEDEEGNSPNYTFRQGDTLLKSTILYNGGFEHEYINVNDPYKTRFARIKVFLLAQARSRISTLIEDNIHNVVRIQTDGFFVKPSDKKYEIGTELGQLKLEYKGKVIIHNVNKITYNATIIANNNT
jgi:hypothetical protein